MASHQDRRSQRQNVSGWSLLTGAALGTAGYAWGRRHRQRLFQRAGASRKFRGEAAEGPAEIPPNGWKDVVWRVYGRLNEDRILVISAGTVFYGILALFPALAALVSIYGMFASPADISKHIGELSSVLPGGAIQVVGDQMTNLTSHGSGSLGIASLVGILVSLWSANAGMKAMYDGLNVAYREREKRNFFQLNLSSLTFTLATIVFAILALAAMVVLPYLTKSLGLGAVGQWGVKIGKWPVMLIIIVVMFACLYRFGPSRDHAKWRWITPGSIFAAVVWIAASVLFSWYAQNFGSYNKTYGSLGAVIGFMTWMWISTIVVLVGGMLNAELEHQTANDTTVGGSQPMGRRGAYVADTSPR